MNSQQMPSVVEEEFTGADADMARRLLGLKRDPSPPLVARVRGIPTSSQRRMWHMPRWAWGMAAAAVLLAVLVAASPPLRAAIGHLPEVIGNVYLTITDRSPDTSDATIIEPGLMSPEAARAVVPFAFGIPNQIPDGWVMDGQVRVNDLGSGPFVEIVWTHPDGVGGTILFLARPASQSGSSPSDWLVGSDSFQEIEINGRPAVIIQGGWDHQSQEWAWPEVTTLIWTVGDVEYLLMASGDRISEADLVTMANSTR